MTAKSLYDGKLVFLGEAPTPEFWQSRWERGLARGEVSATQGVPGHVLEAMERWIPKGSVCLEAGCGMGSIVYGLERHGWHCIGVDSAAQTVDYLRSLGLGLDIRCADVRKLPFADRTFDCYISQGVIEHFWSGYDVILDEMDRVLRSGAFAVISFPSLNLLRSVKRAAGEYRLLNTDGNAPESFYQFALDPADVEGRLASRGYRIRGRRRYEGVLGLSDEAPRPLNYLFSRLYNARRGHLASACRRLLEPVTAGWAGYCCQIVAQKSPDA